jgi:hypothetical protein
MRAKLDVYFRRCVACALRDENHPHLDFLSMRFWKSHNLPRCILMSQLEIASRPHHCVDPLLGQRDLHCMYHSSAAGRMSMAEKWVRH